MKTTHLTIPINEIELNSNYRSDLGDIDQLANSILNVGLLQPILVFRNSHGNYEVVAGNRRLLASKQAGFTEISAIDLSTVGYDIDNWQTLINLTENIQRENVHALDEAEGFGVLLKAGWTVGSIATYFAKSTKYVYSRIKLVELIPEIKEDFRSGWLPEYAAFLFAQLPTGQQLEAYQECAYFSHWDRNKKQWTKDKEYTLNLSATKDRIKRMFKSLNKVAFDINNPDLGTVPCTQCPKNTAVDMYLFNELAEDTTAKCTDNACWINKHRLHIANKVSAIKDTVHYIATDYYISNDMAEAFMSILRVDEYRQLDKKHEPCEYESKGISVSTSSKTFGKIIPICTEKKCPVHAKKDDRMNLSGGGYNAPKKTVDEHYKRKVELIKIEETKELLKKGFLILWKSPFPNTLEYSEQHIETAIFYRVLETLNLHPFSKQFKWMMELVKAETQYNKWDEDYQYSEFKGFGSNMHPEHFDEELTFFLRYEKKNTIWLSNIKAMMFCSQITFFDDYTLKSPHNQMLFDYLDQYFTQIWLDTKASVWEIFKPRYEKVFASFKKNHGREPKI